MSYLQVFLFVQILDYLTTLVGLRIGGSEVSPFIRWVMQLGPFLGLGLVKLLGFAMGAYCVYSGRTRVIVWCNYLFAGLVIWNLCNILVLVHRVS